MHLARLPRCRVVASFVLVILLAGAGCRPQPPDPTVSISVSSSSTKEDWLNAVTNTFNAAHIRTATGSQIQVVVSHGNSGGTRDAILMGESHPTLWSPGDQSWVADANQRWQAQTGVPLISGPCPETVFDPIGFAMWRPMAEAMGWPTRAIGWADILELADDSAGWARYGHPEWGELRLGHTNPISSNSGQLILTALAYFARGVTSGLTPDDVRSQPVVDAMHLIERHTVRREAQSELLIEQMVLGGPAQLHAINTNEAEVLKSNMRYGRLLPDPLAFVLPADGSFWAGHPMCILDAAWVTPEQREAAAIYRSFLLEPEQQALAVAKGLRPASPLVPLQAPISLENGTNPALTPETVPSLGSPSPEVFTAIQEVYNLVTR